MYEQSEEQSFEERRRWLTVDVRIAIVVIGVCALLVRVKALVTVVPVSRHAKDVMDRFVSVPKTSVSAPR